MDIDIQEAKDGQTWCQTNQSQNIVLVPHLNWFSTSKSVIHHLPTIVRKQGAVFVPCLSSVFYFSQPSAITAFCNSVNGEDAIHWQSCPVLSVFLVDEWAQSCNESTTLGTTEKQWTDDGEKRNGESRLMYFRLFASRHKYRYHGGHILFKPSI